MMHPYHQAPKERFWRTAVADKNPLELDIYTPRFPLSPETRIASAGSCFAQHIGREFKRRGYRFVDLEPPPPMLPSQDYSRFGFDLYSARYGNIYSIRQLVQLFQRASGELVPTEQMWTDGTRYFDPFRPAIEPDGFSSEAELSADIAHHLKMVSRLLSAADLFVFTFGLTECWMCRADGAALPTCPGTVAGKFDDQLYSFHNFSFEEVLHDAKRFIEMALSCNPQMRFLFTVSPVPLTATASEQHVLPATVYSKSVLRAVCGTLYDTYPQVDYFPSYELVASHPMRAMFFKPNLRSVSPRGVAHVMDFFFNSISDKAATPIPSPPAESATASPNDDDLVCEELVLESFSR